MSLSIGISGKLPTGLTIPAGGAVRGGASGCSHCTRASGPSLTWSPAKHSQVAQATTEDLVATAIEHQQVAPFNKEEPEMRCASLDSGVSSSHPPHSGLGRGPTPSHPTFQTSPRPVYMLPDLTSCTCLQHLMSRFSDSRFDI